MDCQVCVVTGGNSGIGKEVTSQLMARGCHVIMGCRNQQACAQAKRSLDALKHKGSCECSLIDLQDLASIREFTRRTAAALSRGGQRLSVLVNNAGVMGLPSPASGEDLHLRINHLGPFLLTRLMLPSMQLHSRIVNVSSRAHYWGSLSVSSGGQITGTPRNWFHQYARSKLCNVLHVQELQRRLQPRGITAYAVSPGLVGTSIFSNLPQPLRAICHLAAPLFMRTPAKGAETVVFAALDPGLKGRNVLFMHDKQPKQASAAASKQQLAEALWRASSALVGEDDGIHAGGLVQ